MPNDSFGLIRKAMRQGIVLDSNVLSIYLAGIYENTFHVSVLGRVEGDEDDLFSILERTLPIFRTYITPHVLSETQGVLTKCLGPQTARDILAYTAKYTIQMKEHQIAKNSVLTNEHLRQFGVVDVALYLTSKANGQHLVTKDEELEAATLRYGPVLPMRVLRAYYYEYLVE